ncbi:MAG: YcxB family protein [Rhizobiales bacterium]|nr:YcxB family protein [Hyphomicrobiales bacterium]
MKDVTSEGSVSLEFTLHYDDVYAMSQRARSGLLGLRYVYVWPAMIAVWLIFFNGFYFWFRTDPFTLIDAILIAIVLLAGVAVFLSDKFLRRLRRWGSGYNKLPKKLQMALDKEGILLRAPEASSQIFWSGFERAEETKDHFFLYTTRLCGLIIPKRSLASEESCEAVRRIITDSIPDSRMCRG